MKDIRVVFYTDSKTRQELEKLSAKTGAPVSELLRRAVEDLGIDAAPKAGKPVVTVSIGMAKRLPNLSRHPSSLIKLADGALYKAKNLGRNRSVKDFNDLHILSGFTYRQF